MANLTGHVPLALKVLNSLFYQPNHPDPSTIISNLKETLISTLSPKELLEEERVSACINNSYEYLSHEEKIVGQHLANFPGSFSLDAAIGVLKFMQKDICDESMHSECSMWTCSAITPN